MLRHLGIIFFILPSLNMCTSSFSIIWVQKVVAISNLCDNWANVSLSLNLLKCSMNDSYYYYYLFISNLRMQFSFLVEGLYGNLTRLEPGQDLLRTTLDAIFIYFDVIRIRGNEMTRLSRTQRHLGPTLKHFFTFMAITDGYLLARFINVG